MMKCKTVTWVVIFLPHIFEGKEELEVGWLGIVSYCKAHLKEKTQKKTVRHSKHHPTVY